MRHSLLVAGNNIFCIMYVYIIVVHLSRVFMSDHTVAEFSCQTILQSNADHVDFQSM